MICKACGNEFDRKKFDVCPFCLAPVEEKKVDARITDKNVNMESLSLNKSLNPTEQNDIQSNEEVNISENDIDEESTSDDNFVDVSQIFLQDIDDLSVRAKNVFSKNNITTFDELIKFLKDKKVSDLRGAGIGVEEEVSNVISSVLCGDFVSTNNLRKNHHKMTEETLVEEVIKSIEKGEQPNIHINRIVDMSTRSYNAFYKNGAHDMLSIANLIKTTSTSKIGGLGKKSLNEISEIFYKFIDGVYSIEQKDVNKSLLLENTLIKAKGSRDYEVFLRRSNGETLQEIGETPSWSKDDIVTRERIRQIEVKFIKKNKQIVVDTVNEIWGDKNYFDAQELRDLYEDKEFGIIVVSILKKVSDYIYLDFADIFVKKETYGNVEEKIANLVMDFVGEGIDLYENIEDIDDIFRTNGIDFMGLGELISYMQNSGYRFYGDYVTRGRISYALLCIEIIKEKFPQGIKLNQDNDNPCEELQELRELTKKRFGDIGISEQDRSLSARLGDYLVICDRGKGIAEDNIQIDKSTLHEIKRYINDYNSDKIYYSEIFANFEGLLQMTSNVNNHYFLHGVLMLYFPDDYDYYRDYLIRKNDGVIVENVEDRIKKYIFEIGRPVTKKELKSKFPGFTDIMISMQFADNESLVLREYNLYTIMDFYTYDENDIDKLSSIIDAMLEKNSGVGSENLLFSYVASEMNEFIEKNNMTMPIHLFYFCAKKLGSKFDFRHPNIAKNGMFENLSMNTIVHYLLGKPDKFSYLDFYKIGENLRWPEASVSNAFFKFTMDYYRIDEYNYIKKDVFTICNDIVKNVRSFLESELSDKDYISLLDFKDYFIFGEMEYEWNSYILENIVEKYMPEFTIINQANKDRRYHRAFIVKSNSSISCYSELVVTVFKRKGYTSMSIGKFLSFLVVNGLSYVNIPKEIQNSGYFKIEKEYYVLNN